MNFIRFVYPVLTHEQAASNFLTYSGRQGEHKFTATIAAAMESSHRCCQVHPEDS